MVSLRISRDLQQTNPSQRTAPPFNHRFSHYDTFANAHFAQSLTNLRTSTETSPLEANKSSQFSPRTMHLYSASIRCAQPIDQQPGYSDNCKRAKIQSRALPNSSHFASSSKTTKRPETKGWFFVETAA